MGLKCIVGTPKGPMWKRLGLTVNAAKTKHVNVREAGFVFPK